jgi:hypothetical protein
MGAVGSTRTDSVDGRKWAWKKEITPSSKSRLVQAIDNCIDKTLDSNARLKTLMLGDIGPTCRTSTHLVDRLKCERSRGTPRRLIDSDDCGQCPNKHVRNRIHEHEPSYLKAVVTY